MLASIITLLLLIQKLRQNEINLGINKKKSKLASKKIENEIEELDNLKMNNVFAKVFDYLVKRSRQIKNELKTCKSQKLCTLHKDRAILEVELYEVATLVKGLKNGKNDAL